MPHDSVGIELGLTEAVVDLTSDILIGVLAPSPVVLSTGTEFPTVGEVVLVVELSEIVAVVTAFGSIVVVVNNTSGKSAVAIEEVCFQLQSLAVGWYPCEVSLCSPGIDVAVVALLVNRL